MPKFAIAMITVLAMLFTSTAMGDYSLKHPSREHCRHGYVRRKKHRKAVCVRNSSRRTSPAPDSIVPVSTPVQSTTPGAPVSEPIAELHASPVPMENQEIREAEEYGDFPEREPICTNQIESEQIACEEQ